MQVPTTSVIVIEDDPALLQELAARVTANPELRLLDTATDLDGARALLSCAPPSLVALDLGLPGGSGLSLVAPARQRGHSIVVHTVPEDDCTVFEALRHGAAGYLLKGDPTVDLVAGLLLMRDGGALVSPRIARKVLASFSQSLAPPPEAALLTARERSVLELFGHGCTYGEVANMLGMSVNTVRTHVRRAYEKLHVSSKLEAVSVLAGRR